MGVILENGYEMKTTFWDDFTIADLFGETCTYYLDSYHKKVLSIEKISSNVELQHLMLLCLI